jgi:hypothetical protein
MRRAAKLSFSAVSPASLIQRSAMPVAIPPYISQSFFIILNTQDKAYAGFTPGVLRGHYAPGMFQDAEHQSSGLPNLLRRVAMKLLSALVETISSGE